MFREFFSTLLKEDVELENVSLSMKIKLVEKQDELIKEKLNLMKNRNEK